MSQYLQWLYQFNRIVDNNLSTLHLFAVLAARFYIAKIFFSAGLTKIKDWDTTLFLFQDEYQVPLLPYELAAVLGTFGELLSPILLLIGLFTRFAAIGLFTVNIVAVISLADIAPTALYLHVVWGILLAQLAIYGSGFLFFNQLLATLPKKQPFITFNFIRSIYV